MQTVQHLLGTFSLYPTRSLCLWTLFRGTAWESYSPLHTWRQGKDITEICYCMLLIWSCIWFAGTYEGNGCGTIIEKIKKTSWWPIRHELWWAEICPQCPLDQVGCQRGLHCGAPPSAGGHLHERTTNTQHSRFIKFASGKLVYLLVFWREFWNVLFARGTPLIPKNKIWKGYSQLYKYSRFRPKHKHAGFSRGEWWCVIPSL